MDISMEAYDDQREVVFRIVGTVDELMPMGEAAIERLGDTTGKFFVTRVERTTRQFSKTVMMYVTVRWFGKLDKHRLLDGMKMLGETKQIAAN